MKSALSIMMLAFSLCACSNQQMYNSVQTNRQNECDKLQTIQRQECLKQLGMPYDKYEEERQKLLRDKE